MPVPVLLIVIGTRSEALAGAALLERFRSADPYSLPFEPRVATTGQEDTELLQALDAAGIVPTTELSVKRPHLADANLDACLVDQVERLVRHHDAAAVVAIGCGATAWAAAVVAYFKQVPLIHLGAGVFAPGDLRPFPEWYHRWDLARLARLHLCPDEICARAVQNAVGADAPQRAATAQTAVVGEGADEMLARSLAAARSDPEAEPTLRGLRSDAPRVLAYVRRREHHADGLHPLCRALDALSARHPDHDFVAIHSLQSHICDAMTALIPRRGNLRDVSPLPHPVFVRELMRARLVVTDSAGVAREALLLGRPLVLIGDYSRTESLDALAASGDFAVADMEDGALKTAVSSALSRPAPGPAPASLDPPPAGQRAAQAILEWWKQAEACTTNR